MVFLNKDPLPKKLPIIVCSSDIILPGVTARIPITSAQNIHMVRSRLLGTNSTPNPIIGIVPTRVENSTDHEKIEKETIGVVGQVFQISRTSWPKPTFIILVSGLCRFKVDKLIMEEPYPVALITQLDGFDDENDYEDDKNDPVAQEFRELAAKLFTKISASIPYIIDRMNNILDLMSVNKMADFCASYASLSYTEKYEILNTLDVSERLKKLIPLIRKHVEDTDNNSSSDKKVVPYKSSRLYRVKPVELSSFGEETDAINDLIKKVKESNLPPHVLKVLNREVQRLKRMGSFHPEHSIIWTYVELLMDLPWNVSAPETLDIHKARQDLDADHFAMSTVKRRVLEYLAVRKLKNDMKGPILCFVGPPGVGKTSIAKSVAKTMGRSFHCISLGGLCNQSDIRGHRRTYLGAMPGRIIQALKTVGVKNPVILLDEVDKMGSGAHGSPAAALLEVLDAAQNTHFTDHYVNLPFDLSQVMFLATANNAKLIPPPLLDRMELIKLDGYTEEEKLQIAKRHLLPKQFKEHGIENTNMQVTENCITEIIRSYTREAGVRNLDRCLGSLCRYQVVKIVENKNCSEIVSAENDTVVFDESSLQDILGPPLYDDNEFWRRIGVPGVALGLSWTEVGGQVLAIETSKLSRSNVGNLVLTGQLGNVIKESAFLAVSWLRSVAKQYGLDTSDLMVESDVHIHFPAGAISKDGPSAGIAIASALFSLFSNQPIISGVAMTGEITLSGAVLPVGGVKEKVLAAHRSGLKKVILPKKNYSDLVDIPEVVRNDLEFVLVTEMSEVLQAAFQGGSDTDNSIVLSGLKPNGPALLCKL